MEDYEEMLSETESDLRVIAEILDMMIVKYSLNDWTDSDRIERCASSIAENWKNFVTVVSQIQYMAQTRADEISALLDENVGFPEEK